MDLPPNGLLKATISVAYMGLDKFEAYIEDERARFEVQGVAVAVVQGDDELLNAGFGFADVENERAMSADTVLAIGSSTKAFTVTALGTLVDEGLLDWDKPVREYLPGFRMHDPAATEHLTVRDMMSHRSGLPRHDFLWYGNQDLTRADVVEKLRHLEPSKTFREVWQYNNLMYITAGHLIEVLSGETWEQRVQRCIFDKLGMANSTFTFEAARASGQLATPYAKIDEKVIAIPHRDLDLAGPAGSINATVGDLARWCEVNVNGGTRAGVEIVSEPTIKQIHAPTMVMPEGPQFFDETYSGGYAMGWFLENYRGTKVVHHGGNIDGFTALVTFAPKEKIGVAVLANMNATQLPTVLAYRAFDELLGLDPLPWGERYHNLMETMLGGAKEAKEIRKSKAATAPPSHPLADYVGEYTHPGYPPITISLSSDGKELVPYYNGLDLTSGHVHYDVWEFTYTTFEADFQVSFLTSTDGEIEALRIKLEAALPPIEFKRQADKSLADPAKLAAFEGSYALGPITVKVELKGSDLQASVAGQPPGKLVPHKERVFKVEGGAEGMSIEFEVDDAGKAARAIIQPAGVFERVPDEG